MLLNKLTPTGFTQSVLQQNNVKSLSSSLFFLLRALLLAVPLIFVFWGRELFEFPKVTLIYFISTVFLVLCFKHYKTISNLFSRFISIPSNIIFLLFLIINIISSYLGMDFEHSLLGSYYRSDGVVLLICLFLLSFIFYMYFELTGRNDRGFMFVDTILKSAFIVGALGVIQFISFYFKLIPTEWTFDGRITSTLGHPNFLSGFLLLCTPLIEQSSFTGRKRLVLKIIFFIVILLTFSRLSIFLLLFYFIVNFLITRTKLSKNTFVNIISLIMLLLFMSFWAAGKLAFISKILVKSGDYQIRRISTVFDPNLILRDKRFYLIILGQKAYKERPVLGYGKGNIDAVIYNFRNKTEPLQNLIVDSTHNLFLDTLLESGLLGFSTLAIWFVLIMHELKVNKKYYLLWVMGLFFVRAFFDITSASSFLVLFLAIGLKYQVSYVLTSKLSTNQL